MKKQLEERAPRSVTLMEASTKGPRYRIRLIEGPRWGSSGYYTGEALDSAPAVFTEGTKVYLDHPTRSDETERPERSLRDLIGSLEGSATRESDGVWGTLAVRPHMAELVESLASNGDLDMSIRATAEATPGEVNGQTGLIIKRFVAARSVDLVTEAGAGGRVFELIESARQNTPTSEALTSDRGDQLRRALQTAYADAERDRYVWLRDFDDVEHIVYYERDRGTWRESYTPADDDLSVTLDGAPTEVRPVTTYHPVTSAGPVGEASPATTTQKEQHMPQIEEARLAELTAAANRVTALEAERDSAIQRAEAAEADARKVAREAYANQVTAALAAADLPPVARDRVADALHLDESADVPADPTAAINGAIEAERTYVTSLTSPAKRPLGFGGAGTTPTQESYVNPWGRTINPVKES